MRTCSGAEEAQSLIGKHSTMVSPFLAALPRLGATVGFVLVGREGRGGHSSRQHHCDVCNRFGLGGCHWGGGGLGAHFQDSEICVSQV